MLDGSLAKTAQYVRNALHYKAAVLLALPTEIKNTKILMNINDSLTSIFPLVRNPRRRFMQDNCLNGSLNTPPRTLTFRVPFAYEAAGQLHPV